MLAYRQAAKDEATESKDPYITLDRLRSYDQGLGENKTPNG